MEAIRLNCIEALKHIAEALECIGNIVNMIDVRARIEIETAVNYIYEAIDMLEKKNNR